MWTLLADFGYETVHDELKGDTTENRIHRLENIMTLCTEVHDNFDEMILWFEPAAAAVPGQVRRSALIVAMLY